jgi:PAS domain S-box-containing protein
VSLDPPDPLQAGVAAVRAQEAPLLRLLDSLPAAAYTCDASGCITYFNRQAAELWGRSPRLNDPAERFCGSFRLYAADGSPILHEECWMALALRTGKEFNGRELVIERPDGRRRTVLAHANPILDERGAILGAVNVLIDITDRRRDERAQALLAAIVESSEDAIVSKTLDGVITSWNAGAEHLFGYTAAEAIGQHVTLIIPPDRLTEEDMILERLRRGERFDHFETIRRAKDGRLLNISLTISPIHDATGRVTGASKVARDISAQKQAEAAVVEANRRKDEFLAVLAHELRSPLAPLQNAVEIIRSSPDRPDVVAEFTSMMDRQIQHMKRLVDDLLDVSRITTGKLVLHRARIDLARVVTAAVETTSAQIAEGGHELTVILPPGPVWIDGDRIRLAQALANLLSNAAKYTPPGGKIRLTAERRNSDVMIAVKDTGIGIPAAELEHIFEMFGQADRSLERSRGGLGIGLSLARQLVRLHGGTLEAHSDGPDQGSEFSVRLPVFVEKAEGVAAAPAVRTERRSEKAYRILLADDHRDGAASLAALLSLRGHEVTVAHDGMEAVELAAATNPEVVLLDIGMPKLNGYEAARQMRAQAGGRDRVLIALTGYGDRHARVESEHAGFDAHVVKPVNLDALQSMLASHVRRAQFAPAGGQER